MGWVLCVRISRRRRARCGLLHYASYTPSLPPTIHTTLSPPTGDPYAGWDPDSGLPAQVKAQLTLGLSGLPFSGSDIGGFVWEEPPSEVRYVNANTQSESLKGVACVLACRRPAYACGVE